MRFRLKYILMFIMLVSSLGAFAQQRYVIEDVCIGSSRNYKIDGEPNTTYTWTLTDPVGVVTTLPETTDQINITWSAPLGAYIISCTLENDFGCTTVELGTVNVIEGPSVFAGNDVVLCNVMAGSSFTLADATGDNYSALLWTSSHTGTFDDATILNPIYTFSDDDIAAGNVTLTITAQGLGADGSCPPAEASITITLGTLLADATVTPAGCTGVNNGSLQINASGNNSTYTYSLDGVDDPDGDGLFTGLAPDFYDWAVTDGFCSVSGTSEVLVNDPIVANVIHTDETIDGLSDGIITILDVTGGSGVYEYSYDGINWYPVSTFTGLPPGNYTVIVRDALNPDCTSVIYIVEVLPGLGITVLVDNNVSCFGGNDGQATVTAFGGDIPYTYLWMPGGQTDATATGLIAGDYIVTVTDADGTVITEQVTITEPTELVVTTSQTDPSTIGASDGTATATVTGGTPPYTYLWDDALAQTTETATGLVAGVYTVIVTDANGCTQTATVTLTDPGAPLTVTIINVVNVSCFGANDGEATADVTGGTPPYSYAWSPGGMTTATITGLAPQTYTVVVTDADGNTATADVTITEPAPVYPTFDPIGPLCQNSIPPDLPLISLEMIEGTWVPDIINTGVAGTFTFTFTPNADQCGEVITMDITISDEIIPTFVQIGPLCLNSTPPDLPLVSLENITGTWLPAVIATDVIGTFTYTFTPDDPDQCGVVATLDIEIVPEIIPTFVQIGPLCLNSTPPDLPLVSLENITGTWSPAVIATDVIGTFTYTFTPDNPDQCGVVATLDIEIVPEIIPTFDPIGPLCLNSTPPDLPLVSLENITGTWSPAVITTDVIGTFTYTFTPDDPDQCGVVSTLDIEIVPEIIPTFVQIGPLCLNSTPPDLPLTSDNGITGIWSPAAINTAVVGTTTYTFTPDNPDQCGIQTTMDITISDEILPTFVQIGPLCLNSIPPDLPMTSDNGITGIWSPAVINTSIAGTTTYTFTPDNPDQCGILTTMDITISDEILPTFVQIGPLCLNSIPPDLPLTSDNGITGIWSPAAINTAVVGTTTYTFTPDNPDPCGIQTTMDITISDEILPTFMQIGPLCLNSIPPDLPLTSDNGITGIWSPAVINTSIAGTTTYTFTPENPDQCGIQTTMDITISDEILPTFVQIGPLCLNSAPPDLPLTSDNGITGIWSPAVINTSIAGTTTYTFTPDNPDQCGIQTTMDITISDEIIPTFVQIGPLCLNSIPPDLPLMSDNGITGIWSPAVINTSIAGTTTYTFTPDNPDQCGIQTTMDITISDEIIPTFVQIGPLCLNSIPPDLPLMSDNGITGIWSPASINTSIAGTTTYTFTPDNPDQCGILTTMDITISDEIIPTFVQIGPLCLNSTPPDLPLTSDNGITGIWLPVAINTAVVGTTTYTFTPDNPDQCGIQTTMAITISDEILPTFVQIGPLCLNSTPPDLPLISDNGITGVWSPAAINTTLAGTTTYTFTPDNPDQCGIQTTMAITISDEILPTFVQIGPLCLNSTPPDLPLISDNGITGVWSPAAINTTLAGTTTYTFTPDNPDQCGIQTTMDITISDEILPTFVQIGPLCLNSTPPDLPLTSDNGITGVWSPAAINTSIAGTTTYTFTPDDPDQCGILTTMDITISDEILPTFVQIGPLCLNSIPPDLPLISDNGIAGIWSPAAINTTLAGTTTYTFTPENPDQCGIQTTMDITISDEIIPTFVQIGPLCLNSPAPSLPLTSVEGYAGTWNPAVISTLVAGSTRYTFTPSDPCGVIFEMDIVVDPLTIPTFDAIGQLCLNSTPPLLVTTSNNGITGTWSPDVINTTYAGTSTYIFTPDAGQCAEVVSISITVDGPVIDVDVQHATNGESNGQVYIIASGGTDPLEYSLDGITWQTSPVFMNLPPDDYTAYVRDAAGCQASVDFTVGNVILGLIHLIPDRVLQCVGDEGLTPIYVKDFRDVKSFKIQLTYDPTILSFNGIYQAHPNMTASAVETTLVAPGILEVKYAEPVGVLDIPDDETLIALTFLGASPGTTNLNWNFIECVIFNADNYEIPYILTSAIAEVVPAPDLSVTASGDMFCSGDSLTLQAHSLDGQQLNYQWTHPRGFTHNGDTWDFPELSVLDAGLYTVSASNQSCAREKTIEVTVYASPEPIISRDEDLCFGNPVLLDAGGVFAEYEWSMGPDSLIISYAPTYLASEAGIYRVKVTNDLGCKATSEVNLVPCITEVQIPNAFTPNGDGLNDTFYPIFTEGSIDPGRYNMSIYTKWGQLIFTTSDYTAGWDGTYMGEPVMAETYVYIISYEVPSYVTRRDHAPLTGTVTLLR